MRVWIDIDNPPQVQYLEPLEHAFRAAGADVVLTARDYGNTFELLEARGAAFTRIGERFGPRKWQKAVGLGRRTATLGRFFRGQRRPNVLVAAGRASALLARLLRIPAFVIVDYEYVDLTLYRLFGASVLHPDVIPAVVFERRGFPRDRLIPFRGLKEDVSFSGLDPETVAPHRFPGLDDSLVRVLFRPPAEESHYYRSASGAFSLELLARLAGRNEAVVVFSPRYPRQEEYLSRFTWANEPVVLREAVPFVSLLRAVDLVVSSGGTMIREAAYLGVPAYSIFQGEVGAVDRRLAELGRLRLVSTAADAEKIELRRAPPAGPLALNPDLPRDIVEAVLSRTEASRSAR